MRGFEQAISKPRYHLTQFHCPAMLKLVTVDNSPRHTLYGALFRSGPPHPEPGCGFYFLQKRRS